MLVMVPVARLNSGEEMESQNLVPTSSSAFLCCLCLQPATTSRGATHPERLLPTNLRTIATRPSAVKPVMAKVSGLARAERGLPVNMVAFNNGKNREQRLEAPFNFSQSQDCGKKKKDNSVQLLCLGRTHCGSLSFSFCHFPSHHHHEWIIKTDPGAMMPQHFSVVNNGF